MVRFDDAAQQVENQLSNNQSISSASGSTDSPFSIRREKERAEKAAQQAIPEEARKLAATAGQGSSAKGKQPGNQPTAQQIAQQSLRPRTNINAYIDSQGRPDDNLFRRRRREALLAETRRKAVLETAQQRGYKGGIQGGQQAGNCATSASKK